eukprot:7355899-Pyramimonas_sp.AAC.1
MHRAHSTHKGIGSLHLPRIQLRGRPGFLPAPEFEALAQLPRKATSTLCGRKAGACKMSFPTSRPPSRAWISSLQFTTACGTLFSRER